MKLPSRQSTSEHAISEHVSMRWSHEGRTVLITLAGDTRKAIDDWYHLIDSIAQEWEPQQTYLAIYDLSGIGLTPYFRKRSIDVAKSVAHLQGRYAIVIPPGDPQSGVMRLYFEVNIRSASARQGQVFEDVATAQNWLEERL